MYLMPKQILMDLKFIDDQIQRLNYEWFLRKREFFIREPLYVEKLNRIKDTLTNTETVFNGEDFVDFEKVINIDIDLEHYCWNSHFEGSTLKAVLLDEQLVKTLALPVDGNEICAELIEKIKLDTLLYSDATAINQYLTLVKKQIPNTISKLTSPYNDIPYNDTLNLFLKNTEDIINNKFTHIYEQIELISANKDYRASLTLEKCNELANVKINENRFITDTGDIERGAALFYLLDDDSVAPKDLKIRIEDWADRDVYYLLHRLQQLFKVNFTPAGLEQRRILYMKTNKPFKQSGYNTFKSQKIKTYRITRKKQIDDFLKQLAER